MPRIVIQRIACCRICRQQALQPLLERLIAFALGIEPRGPFRRIGDCQRGREELDLVHIAHPMGKPANDRPISLADSAKQSRKIVQGFRG